MKKLIVCLVFLGCGGVDPLVQSYEPGDSGVVISGLPPIISPPRLVYPGIPNSVDSGLAPVVVLADAGQVVVDAGQPVTPSDGGCPEDDDKDDKKVHHPNHDPNCEKH